jgi:hypothetical protein
MPRSIDFSVLQYSEWSEVRLQAPIHGDFEMTDEERNRLFDMAPRCSFHPQFTFERPYEINRDAETPSSVVCVGDAAHAWLSLNRTGPWYWSEEWINHGHSLLASVFIERLCDQEAFFKKFQTMCTYNPNDAEKLDQLAVLRGVLPNLSANESVHAWEEENRGFKLEPLDASDYILKFTIPELEIKFNEKWGHLFKKIDINGEQNSYMGSRTGTEDARWWLFNDASVSSFNGFVTEDSGEVAIRCIVRYPQAIQAFTNDLEALITRDEGSGTFILRASRIPPRDIPADFMAYLRGEREDYERPHLGRL